MAKILPCVASKAPLHLNDAFASRPPKALPNGYRPNISTVLGSAISSQQPDGPAAEPLGRLLMTSRRTSFDRSKEARELVDIADKSKSLYLLGCLPSNVFVVCLLTGARPMLVRTRAALDSSHDITSLSAALSTWFTL